MGALEAGVGVYAVPGKFGTNVHRRVRRPNMTLRSNATEFAHYFKKRRAAEKPRDRTVLEKQTRPSGVGAGGLEK